MHELTTDYKRTYDDRDAEGKEDLEKRIKELLRVMTDNPNLKDLSIDDLLSVVGEVLLEIKAIDYNEIERWREAQKAILMSL